MARVLVVEDDPWMADCYCAWLRQAGYTVEHCVDPQEAIDSIDVSRPDVILLDLLLPYANGVQLLHTLRSYSDLAGIPIVLCSSSLPTDLPDMRPYGVQAVFEKSALGPHHLRQAVQEALHAAV